MKTTKKEIRENTRSTRRSGFGNGYTHNYNIGTTCYNSENGVIHATDDRGTTTMLGEEGTKQDFINAV
jgi:hypothetical protein